MLGLAACTLLAGCGERAPVAADGDAADPTARDASPRVLTGADLWLACQGCHSIDAGEPHRVGPNLYGIVGAPAASRPGYTYSEALTGSGITWSPGLLRGYVMNAESMVPGTWMAYRDVMTPGELDRLVDYVVERAAGAEDEEGRGD
ncbi:c-type cytochrome [Lentisalinibacter orientalis]|uniref:c-type cytochrome n=1 Tax=Lentisalinibacter orientalis TaxID=2992241 RepID=UPI003865B9E8